MSFKITLSPIAGNEDTVISVSGKKLTYNGVETDFSAIEDGDIAEGVYPVIGDIKRTGTEYELTVACIYDSSTAEPNQSTDINDYIQTRTSGTLSDPIARIATDV